MAYKGERCGSCCKLAWAKVDQGEDLPLKEDGSCGHLTEENGQYACDIFETRPETCRASFAQKKYNINEDEYEILANKARTQIRKIVNYVDP